MVVISMIPLPYLKKIISIKDRKNNSYQWNACTCPSKTHFKRSKVTWRVKGDWVNYLKTWGKDVYNGYSHYKKKKIQMHLKH